MTTLYFILFIITFTLFAIGAFAGYIEGDQDYKESCRPDNDQE